jgi:ABC-type protease/lipase transport system fused ATPase/permease subunit
VLDRSCPPADEPNGHQDASGVAAFSASIRRGRLPGNLLLHRRTHNQEAAKFVDRCSRIQDGQLHDVDIVAARAAVD